ncbi:MAG TPA: endolytic transglycosylase MltG, partial [Xanthobacteraceae bacterium]|nr:endolytic transglycosylase MltG [Xanthobacteraceae bacterium]
MLPRRGLQSPNEALQPEPAPLPPPRRRRRQGLLAGISGFLSFLLVVCVAGGLALVAGYKRIQEPGPLSTDKVLFIAPGTDVPEIIAQLEREGVIDSPMMMNAVLVIEGNRSKLKAGEYLFREHASLRDVMDIVINGRQVLHAITIPEGLTSEQVVQRLRDSDVLSGDVREPPREGTLLPETYKVVRGSSRSGLIRTMQDDHKKLVDQIWSRRAADLPIRTPYELVTLASIVEKETGKADERPHVASVFVNRLHKRMRLQSDPTIVYGLVGGTGTLGRGILRSEIDKP